MPEKVAIALVATGPYNDLLPGALQSIRENLLPRHERRLIIFTDDPHITGADVSAYQIPHLKWPCNTLFRYNYLRHAKDELLQADVVMYIDVDMLVATPVELPELLPPGAVYFGVESPWWPPGQGTFETDPRSTAWFDPTGRDTQTYWQACFWGGRAGSVLAMIDMLADRVVEDLDKGVVAVWHDESHLNRFYVENKHEVHTLPPAFAYPSWENFDYAPRILHIDKSMEVFPRHAGASAEEPTPPAPPVPRALHRR